MATLLASPVPAPASVAAPKRWTLEECDRVATVMDMTRVELLDGELIRKVSKNNPHLRAAGIIQYWLAGVFGQERVHAEPTLDLIRTNNSHSAPEPDVAVLHCGLDDLDGRPRSGDVVMVVEVSDTSLEYDLGRKRDLYAEAGVPEYWVMDVNGRQIFVHLDPVDGRYRSIVIYSGEEVVSPRGQTEHGRKVVELFAKPRSA
jgi:Uma2 family endonuclease